LIFSPEQKAILAARGDVVSGEEEAELQRIMERSSREIERRLREEQQQEHERSERQKLLRDLPYSYQSACVRDSGNDRILVRVGYREVTVTEAEFRDYFPRVPPPPPLAALPHVDREHAEALRRHVWANFEYNKVPADWNAERKSYPSDPDGTCRHKASYLRDHLGGRCIFGFRTDKRAPERHAVLEIEIKGERLILDYDQTWLASEAPFEPNEIPWIPAIASHQHQQQQQKSQSDNDLVTRALEDLTARVAALEGKPQMSWRGVYDKGTPYHLGDVVHYAGSAWCCTALSTVDRPGTGTGWQMVAQRGKDVRDARQTEGGEVQWNGHQN
jgi:hypothetical protein